MLLNTRLKTKFHENSKHSQSFSHHHICYLLLVKPSTTAAPAAPEGNRH